ncbi:hypothetical protein [Stenotrophomonas nitritireducens]|uniref:hypothetical protein n=1 Tax=Stenotrophomonas nitritireducens TaxID=83617 RepID=UPI003D970840
MKNSTKEEAPVFQPGLLLFVAGTTLDADFSPGLAQQNGAHGRRAGHRPPVNHQG